MFDLKINEKAYKAGGKKRTVDRRENPQYANHNSACLC